MSQSSSLMGSISAPLSSTATIGVDMSSGLCTTLQGLQMQSSPTSTLSEGPQLGNAVGTMWYMRSDYCRFVKSVKHGDLVLDVYMTGPDWWCKTYFKCTWRGPLTRGVAGEYATTTTEENKLSEVKCVFVRTAPSVCRQFDCDLTNELEFDCPWSQLDAQRTALFGTIFDQALSSDPALGNDCWTTSDCLPLHDVLKALNFKSKKQNAEWIVKWNALGLGDFSTNPSVVADWDIDRILVFTTPNGREVIRAELAEVNKLWCDTLAELKAST